jgi:hypothetical protein
MIYGQCDLATIEARLDYYNYVTWGAIALSFLVESLAREVAPLMLAGQRVQARAKAKQVCCLAEVKIVIGVVLAVFINPCSGMDGVDQRGRTCHCKYSKIYPTLCIGLGLRYWCMGRKLCTLVAAVGEQLPTTAQLPAPDIPIAQAQVVPALATPYDEAPLVCGK